MNKKWTGLIISVVMLSIIIIVFPLVMEGSDDILRTRQTDTSTNVIVAANSGTMPLTAPLYDGSEGVDWVVSVTSNSGTDTPAASTWANNVLTVTGLTWGGATRTLTAVYDSDNTVQYTGLQETVEVTPLLMWVGLMILTGAGALFGVRALRRE